MSREGSNARADGPTPGRGWNARGLRIGLLVILLVAGVAAALDRNGHRRAQATLARIRARMPSERERVLAIPRGRPAVLEPAAEGEAGAVARAFFDAVERVPTAERDVLDSAAADDPRAALGERPRAAEQQDALLSAHPEPLRALAPLLHVASTPAPLAMTLEEERAAEAMPHGGTWIDVAAERAIARGDRAEGLRIATLGVGLAHEVARGGSSFYLVVGAGLEVAATRRIVESLEAAGAGPDEVRASALALGGLEAHRPRMSTALAVDRVMHADAWLASAKDLNGWGGRIPRPRLGYASMESYLARSLDAFDDDYSEVADAVVDLDTNAKVALTRVAPIVQKCNPVVRMSLVVVEIVARRHATARAWNAVARTALALRAATLRRGARPARLSELVPEFLPTIPLDPWDGAPVRYRDGKVWSIGEDGVDDGGRPPNGNDDRLGDYAATLPTAR